MGRASLHASIDRTGIAGQRRRSMLALTPILLAFTLAAGQPPASVAWRSATGTGSCSVTDVDLADATHAFAAGSFNCGLVSSDGGRSWAAIEVVPQQGQSLLWAHAASADTLYAARIQMYRSDDGGQQWVQLSDIDMGGSFFDVHFHDAEHLVAVRAGQILTSVDGGVHWATAYPGEFNVNFDELHFPDPSIGYATGGVVRDAGEAGTVLRSDDGGQTWTLLAFPHGKITAADFPDAGHGMVATQSQGLFVTADGAQSWQAVADVPGGAYVNDLAHRDAYHWYATSSSGCLFETRDAGANWQTAFCDAEQRALASIDLSGSTAVAAGNDGLVVWENRVFGDGFDAALP
jgi:photosystem II stability/assembly factor-like uncharacterized protein